MNGSLNLGPTIEPFFLMYMTVFIVSIFAVLVARNMAYIDHRSSG
jgi:hypothetical protein